MKRIIQLVSLTIIVAISSAFINNNEEQNYKCMIQMMNYSGEEAYVVVSLINPEGNYEKTLYVQGDDEEWYPDLKKWWAFSDAKKENIDGISGATIGNGERNIISFTLNKSHIDSGYILRFESAVEDQNYHTIDAEVPLKGETITNKTDGKGYIRYVRMMPN